jgi:hypothetical protein
LNIYTESKKRLTRYETFVYISHIRLFFARKRFLKNHDDQIYQKEEVR